MIARVIRQKEHRAIDTEKFGQGSWYDVDPALVSHAEEPNQKTEPVMIELSSYI